MLSSNMLEKGTGTVDLTHLETKMVQMLVQYLYGDACSGIQEDAFTLMMVAEQYMLQGLKKQCEMALERYAWRAVA